MASIKTLRISSFRNINDITIRLKSPFVCFCGENAQGKTNILEGIYLLANLKSFRAGGISDWIKNDKNESSVAVEIKDDLGTYRTGYNLSRDRRNYFIDNNKLKGIKEIMTRLRVISYSPSSYELILGDDMERRRFFDRVVYSIDINHLEDVIYYNRVLKNRNTAIKQKKEYRLWDELMAAKGEKIVERRGKAIKLMQEYFREMFNLFFSTDSNVTLIYKPSAGYTKEQIQAKLDAKSKIDELKGFTTIGPHRDKIEIMFNGRAAKRVISTGQAKLIAFLFKIAKSRFIREFSQRKPIFLYDDVSAFLDERRLMQLVEIIKKEGIQIISTSVDNNLFRRLFSDSVQFITVREGRILNDG